MAARREVAGIAACREVSRIAACREVSRIAAWGEAPRIAGGRNLIRRLDQRGAVRRKPPEPHNHAHKETRAAIIPTNTQVIGGRNLFMELAPCK